VQTVRDLVFARGNRWQRGEMAWLLWQTGERDVPTDHLAEPYALQIASDWAGAATAWHELGCPYEEACALAESDDPALVHQAIAIFEDLGASPAIAFRTVVLPLTLPGAGAGFLLVFIPAAGEVVIPELLGPPEARLVGRVLWDEFFRNRDWPLAAALAVLLLVVLIPPIRLFQRLEAR
jgi:ABC-type sulfate transport system permease component